MQNMMQFSEKLHVLYVEDNKEAREGTLGLLHNIFKEITTAVNGRDGLEKFEDKNSSFDLIITDINMPKMNGIEMITKIREENKEIPILVLSAYNESGYFVETIKQGVEGYLLKPIDIKQLLEMLNKTVEKIYLKQELLEYQQELESKVQEQVSHIKKQTKELHQQYYYDTLTTLANKNSLVKVLGEEMTSSIVLIEINNFALTNDVYGSTVGDKILVNISKVLLNLNKNRYKVFTISPCIFVILDMEDKNLTFSDEVIAKTLQKIESTHVSIEKNLLAINIDLNVSIASSMYSQDLFQDAKLALDYARGKNLSLIHYSKDLEIEKYYKQELDTVQMFKNALQDGRIVPFFQEIVKQKGTKTYECLVRIIDNDEVISPSLFLDAIKKTKYYNELTKVMIAKSFTSFEKKEMDFSINISFEDIVNQDTMTFLENKINDTGLAKKFIIEIVESESIDNFEIVKDFILKMQKLGVRIAIDDFGSGYSNFSRILELNPDFMKIDGSLVEHICEDKKSFTILKSIVNLANELDIKIIVEYVHNKEVYEKIKDLNITGFQGYYLGKPSQTL